ncbi:hypothetical protein F4604DRAFT_1973361 [Suillus subluteus]|nr:hypothetical protein F4604DRAFT_1973361 [Suillus subluteus]
MNITVCEELFLGRLGDGLDPTEHNLRTLADNFAEFTKNEQTVDSTGMIAPDPLPKYPRPVLTPGGGQVRPVGGLKKKILAAHCAGIKTILAPAANRTDFEENVPESVKTGIRFVYVEDVREVLHEVFRGQNIVERWKDTLSSYWFFCYIITYSISFDRLTGGRLIDRFLI